MNLLKSRVSAILADGDSRLASPAEQASVLVQLAIDALFAAEPENKRDAAIEQCHKLVDEAAAKSEAM